MWVNISNLQHKKNEFTIWTHPNIGTLLVHSLIKVSDYFLLLNVLTVNNINLILRKKKKSNLHEYEFISTTTIYYFVLQIFFGVNVPRYSSDEANTSSYPICIILLRRSANAGLSRRLKPWPLSNWFLHVSLKMTSSITSDDLSACMFSWLSGILNDFDLDILCDVKNVYVNSFVWIKEPI